MIVRGSWLLGVILVLPGLLLAISGYMHLCNGLSVDAAFPVPLALSLDRTVPRVAYADAVKALYSANLHDGDAQISRAQAGAIAGENPRTVLREVEVGLVNAPASNQGLVFYAEMQESSDPKRSARALDAAFTIAPYDFFWAGRRARLSARIWKTLPDDTRALVLRQARMLWDEPMLHNELLRLLGTDDGARIVTRAYADEPETLRAINRFVSATRRELQSVKP